MAKFFGKEESGFSDPLGGDNFNANQFDIIQFINANQDDNDTPLDSPLDPSFYLNNCPMLNTQNNNNICGHQQQINGHNGHMQSHQNQNNGLMGQHYGISGHMARGGQTRLPDSPPITDISAAASSVGASSASPSSGSDSPFSPDAYRNYNGLILNGQPIQSGVLTMHMPQQTHDPMLVGMHQNQRNIIQQQSPHSEFLSPYPPSQSTPGSHSGSQVSPPALTQRGSAGSVSSSGSGGSGNCPYGILGQQQSDYALDLYNQAMSHNQPSNKRRRVNSNENSTNGAPILPNVKCEINPNIHQSRPSPVQSSQQRQFGCQVQENSQHVPPRRRPQPPSSQLSCEDYSDDMISSRTIKFTPFMLEQWSPLYDSSQRQLPLLNMAVVADKGFNFNSKENSFINQKKNHFQITSSITRNTNVDIPYFVRLPSGELQPIQEYMLAFCGVKQEMPTSEIPIKQSLPDRKTVPHEPVRFQLDATIPTKHTVPRLHFSETTLNNHRKSQKPNPEQRYFLLVVKLLACTPVGPVLIQAYQSDRIIVRASNPGQFEQPESDVAWQKGANGNVLTFNGKVAIGTDKPISDAQLSVLGNVVTTGQITRPSDRRVKEDIADIDTKDAITRLAQMRIVEYSYKPEIAQQWGLSEESRHRVGVIAQELAEVLPDAVRDNGEFLTVDDTRIFYDTVAAAQELYRLTGNLECKIDQVEKISHKLARFAQKRKNHLGSMASGISDFSNLFGGATLGGDNKSYISYSRTSLASAGGDDSAPAKRSKGHRRCRSSSFSSSIYCHRSDQALCNSKLTQGTIVALVVVMGLCLLAMSTLYVVDWYNRTYVYRPHYPYHAIVSGATPSTESQVGNIYEVKPPDVFTWTPPSTIKAPPLAATCGLRTHCPSFCCASHMAYNTLDGKNSTAADTFLALDDSDNSFRAFVAFSNATTAVDGQPFKLASGAKIEVVNLKTNVDSRYCETKEACNARKGRYNLYIPMSDHLPTIPLQLKFSVDNGLFVDNCGSLLGFDHKGCEFDRNSGMSTGYSSKPTSHRVSENVFEVSVGGFLKSAYRFRVGHTTESCRMSEDQQGRSFDEYNLVFYRTCLIKRTSQTEGNTSA